MAFKTVSLENIGPVNLYKRKGTSSIRLGFDSKGIVRVTQPTWLPYEAGIRFALTKTDWIKKHQPPVSQPLTGGGRIGKAHHLTLIQTSQVKSVSGKVVGGSIQIKYPVTMTPDDPLVQKRIETTSKKALLAEADQLLPQRLKVLASKYGFTYKSITIKQLRSKWGSCDQNKHITLNYYLMQLPWDLIDYVLLHELVHTQYLNHGVDFWQRFEEVLPNARKIRKQLKTYKTTVVHSS